MKDLGPVVGACLFEFGPFVADPVRGLLRQNGLIVPLTPKAFAVLLALIEQRGQTVDKDDLLKRVWPDTVVEESNLVQHVSMLRKALNDHLKEHRYIVTVPGHGYRFVADLKEIMNGEDALAGDGAGAIAATSDAAVTATRSWEAGADGVLRPVPLTRHDHRPPSRLWTIVPVWATVPAVGAILIFASVALRIGSRSPVIHAPERKLWQLTFDPGLERVPTWSPDGRWIAYSSDRSGNADLWVHPVGQGNPIRITTSPAHDSQPDWSPDGQQIAFRSERDGGGLFVVPAFGGAERKLADFGYLPRWSADGSRIRFLSSTLKNVRETPKVYLLGLDGSAPREVLADLLHDFADPRVVWHPDGRRLSVWGRHRRSGWSFWTVPLTREPPVKSELSAEVEQRLRDAAVTFTDVVWSPSGRALYFEGSSQGVANLWRVRVDPQTLHWIGGPDRLTTGAGRDQDIALSADGRRLAFNIHREQTRLWSLPFDPVTGRIRGPGQAVTDGGADESYAALSSDGKKLAYVTVRGTKEELWERSLEDGRERLLVASEGSPLIGPHWSRDGSWLAYLRGLGLDHPKNGQAIVLLSVDRGDGRRLTTPGTRASPSDWSSDGFWIIGACLRGVPQRASVCLLPVASAPHAERDMRVVASHPELNLWAGRFSPDSRWISFTASRATEAGVSTIYVVPASGGEWTRITEGQSFDDKLHWAPDGRTVYFVSNRTGAFNVWGRRFDPIGGKPVGEPFQVTTFVNADQIVAPYIGPLEIAVARDRLVLPITNLSGETWILDNVDR